jgi:hypothetical protein
VPLYDLAIATDANLADRVADSPDWVNLPDGFQSSPNFFVARITGKAINRRVPSGSMCLFRANPSEVREDKVVLVYHPEISDRELGGQFSVRVFGSELVGAADGSRSKRIILRPDSDDAGFTSIVFDSVDDGETRILAELVAVIY